jgi:hypothetical protein
MIRTRVPTLESWDVSGTSSLFGILMPKGEKYLFRTLGICMGWEHFLLFSFRLILSAPSYHVVLFRHDCET